MRDEGKVSERASLREYLVAMRKHVWRNDNGDTLHTVSTQRLEEAIAATSPSPTREELVEGLREMRDALLKATDGDQYCEFMVELSRSGALVSRYDAEGK